LWAFCWSAAAFGVDWPGPALRLLLIASGVRRSFFDAWALHIGGLTPSWNKQANGKNHRYNFR
jgi:hypothetical protein